MSDITFQNASKYAKIMLIKVKQNRMRERERERAVMPTHKPSFRHGKAIP